MVGSGYIGNWAIDYENLEDDFQTLTKLICLSKPTLSIEELRDYIYFKYIDGSKEKYVNDDLSFIKSTNIDVGNFSLYDIFNDLPVSPASITTGIDYYHHGILGVIKSKAISRSESEA